MFSSIAKAIKTSPIQPVQSILLILLVVTSGCVSYQQLYKKNVQLYNQAVSAEAAYRLEVVEKGMVDFSNSPAKKDFQVAYDSINSFVDTYESRLREDNFLGNVLAIKAMCEYSLDKPNEAMETAKVALPLLGASASEKKSRDEALMVAMPGLVKINQLFEKKPADDQKLSEAEYLPIENLARKAVQPLQNGQKVLEGGRGKNKAYQFLLISELALYKNWLDVAFNAVGDGSDAAIAKKRAREDEITKMAKPAFNKLEQLIGTSKPKVVEEWRNMLSL